MNSRLCQLLPSILNALSSLGSFSLVLGGSYSTNEQCIIDHGEKEYWLSDVDLLVITENRVDNKLSEKVYCDVLELSKAANQQNPYFHIGLKIRTRDQFEQEKNSMYYWEIASSGVILRNEGARLTFESQDNIVNYFSREPCLFNYLYKWGLTRLWCNILFFPISSLTCPASTNNRIWYSYFYARGAMDWITWRLLEGGQWDSKYTNRFDIWSEGFCEAPALKALMAKCLGTRLGISQVDYAEIFCDVLGFSLENIRRYKSLSEYRHDDYELLFVEAMLHVIAGHLQGSETRYLIANASYNFSMLTGNVTLNEGVNEWSTWHRLREEYCQFRFSHSETDRRDHSVYSKHFLKLGSLSPRRTGLAR